MEVKDVLQKGIRMKIIAENLIIYLQIRNENRFLVYISSLHILITEFLPGL